MRIKSMMQYKVIISHLILVSIITLCNFAAPSNGVTEKPEGPDKNGRLYDKAGKVRKIRHEQKEADGEGNAS